MIWVSTFKSSLFTLGLLPSELGFPISSQKIIPRKTEQDGMDHCFVGILPVLRNKKHSEFLKEEERWRKITLGPELARAKIGNPKILC